MRHEIATATVSEKHFLLRQFKNQEKCVLGLKFTRKRLSKWNWNLSRLTKRRNKSLCWNSMCTINASSSGGCFHLKSSFFQSFFISVQSCLYHAVRCVCVVLCDFCKYIKNRTQMDSWFLVLQLSQNSHTIFLSLLQFLFCLFYHDENE